MAGTEHTSRGALRLLMAAALALTMMGGLAATAAAAPAPITEFTSSKLTAPSVLTAGSDGNLWFVDQGAIGRITPAGQIDEFAKTGILPEDIVPGPGGDMWFSDGGTTKGIDKITPAGTITQYSYPDTAGLLPGSAPYQLTQGPNDTVWFTDGMAGAIGRVAADGTIAEFTLPPTVDPTPDLGDAEITAGPDGNVYISDRGNVPGIIKVTPTGTITETSTASNTAMPNGIAGGNDGNVWFTDTASGGSIGLLTTTGTLTEFGPDGSPNGLHSPSDPDAITAGPDGNEWFDDQNAGTDGVGKITPAGQITEFPLTGEPADITTGVDGNLWLPQSGPEGVDRVTPTGTVTDFTAGLNLTMGGTDLQETNITVGSDGNLWTIDKGTPKAIVRINVQSPPKATTGAASAIGQLTATVAGTVNPLGADTTVSIQYGGSSVLGSTVSAGTVPASGTASPVNAALTGLPAGSTVFYRVVATNAYGTSMGATQSFTTAAPTPIKVITTPGATTRTITASVGNQRIALVTPLPTACTASSNTLSVTLTSSTIPGSKAAKLHFVRAALFLDKGVKHVRRTTKRVRGKRVTVKKTSYTANRIVRKLPGTPSLKLTGLKTGTHTLKVTALFHKTVKRKGRKVTVSVSKTLKASFTVC